MPVDAVVASEFSKDADSKVVDIDAIPADWMGLDIGPKTVALYADTIKNSKLIIWNGPMGIFEIDKFSKGTFRIAHAIADSYAYSIVGGGDTANAADKAGEKENISFISTGGGASLELLEGKVLPGFENLEKFSQ
jgi:phosphoglycerate kinase